MERRIRILFLAWISYCIGHSLDAIFSLANLIHTSLPEWPQAIILGPIIEEFIFRFMCIAVVFLFFININIKIEETFRRKELIQAYIIWALFSLEFCIILVSFFPNSISLSINDKILVFLIILIISLITLVILILVYKSKFRIDQEKNINTKDFLLLFLILFSSFSWAASHMQGYGALRLISVFFIGIGTSLAFISITNLQEFSKDFPLSKKIYSLGIGIIMVILAHAWNNSLPYIFPNQDFFTQIFVLVLDVIGIGILFLIWYIICYKLIILNKNFNILM